MFPNMVLRLLSFLGCRNIQEVQNLFQISVYMFTNNNITFGYMVYLWFFILIKLIFYYYFYFQNKIKFQIANVCSYKLSKISLKQHSMKYCVNVILQIMDGYLVHRTMCICVYKCVYVHMHIYTYIHINIKICTL